MAKKVILFLGTSLLGALYIQKATEKLGFHPILLLHLDDYSGDPKRAIEAVEYYEADINSLDDVSRVIDENGLLNKYEIVAITSFLDEVFKIVIAVAKKFKVTGPDPILSQLTDKIFIQEIIPEFSPPSLNFTVSDISKIQLEQFFRQHDSVNEFVLKPGVSSGAVGISILTKDTSFDAICQLISSSCVDKAQFQQWLLQPRVDGRLYSLEGYVKNGEIFFLGFARRVRKDLTEIANEYPIDEDISINIKKRCKTAIKTLVERSNYMYGYFHCEFIINNSMVYLIDPNMGRFAGSANVQHFAKFYQLEPVDILKHVVDLGLFKGRNTTNFQYPTYPTPSNSEKILTINYCIEKPAFVYETTLPADITSFHIQVADSGKSIPEVGVSDSAWIGFLTGFSSEVLRDIERISINTNNGTVPPYYLLSEKKPLNISPQDTVNSKVISHCQ